MSNTMTANTTTIGVLKFEIRELAAQDYLGTHFTSPLASVGEGVRTAMMDLYERMQMTGAVPAGPPFLVASPPAGDSMEIEVGAPCVAAPEPAPGQHKGRLEATRAAVALFRGPYADIAPAYGMLFEWAAEQQLRPAGAVREVYLNGPGDVSSDLYLTELVLPVE